MPFDYSRTDRVAELIKRDIALLIRDKIKDPRVGMVSIMDVEVTKDFRYAKVYFDTLQTELAQETQEGLNRASGFLRRELARGIKLRAIPSLTFIYDDTEARANELSSLIDRAVASDRAGNKKNNKT
jgi:ribosome-binding factor A